LEHRACGFAQKTNDNGGLFVASEFIDLPTHYDAQIRWAPLAPYPDGTVSSYIVLGNCDSGALQLNRIFASARC